MARKRDLLWSLLLIGGGSACLSGGDKVETGVETGVEDTVDSSVEPDDLDGDGYGAALDCDDENAEIHPGMEETCNGIDDNCNGLTDEGFGDVDGDGTPDCMDAEECDGLDNDGDGEIDEDFGDVDGDGIADCLDREVCDGVDNDCDGTVDGATATDALTWYLDLVVDGFGDLNSPVVDCSAPSGYIGTGQDCDDGDATVNPAAAEDCDDAIDHDCNGFASCSFCGDGALEQDEEYEPPPGPFTNLLVDSQTCRWDFSGVSQLYCGGTCTWAGGSDCQKEDADILCKLITDNPNSTATSWDGYPNFNTALAGPGVPCSLTGFGVLVSGLDRGTGVAVTWQDFSILSNHGFGKVVANPVCTNP